MTQDMLIAGEFVSGAGDPIEIENPATGGVIASVPGASRDQVDAAVDAAVEAQPFWQGLAQSERSAALRAIADDLESQRESIAEVLSLDTGRAYTRNLVYVDFAAAVFRQYAELARLERGRVVPSNDAGQLSLVLRVPFGVVAALVPWNYPLSLLVFKLAPAIAVGNTVVAKGAEETTLSTLRLGPIFERHLPAGVVNLVAGGRAVGEQLVAHDGTDLVAFTGSTAAGRAIGAACAERTKRAHLELGGKDPAIVFDDVDPEVAAQGVVWAAFLNAGQVCTSTERAYVHRSISDEFIAHAVRLAEALRVGDPLDPETQLGPMRTAAGRRKVGEHLAEAIAGGAEVLTGGTAPDGPGYFFPPTIVTGVDHDMRLMREETFGPVLPIMTFDSDDEAFALAADTPYGLGASLYTTNAARVRRAYETLRVGNVWVNDPVVDNLAAPFGGSRASGNARELGREGMEAFTDVRHVHWNISPEPKSWWFPYPD